MKKTRVIVLLLGLAVFGSPAAAFCQFLEIIPSTDSIAAGQGAEIGVDLALSAPGAEALLDLATPETLFVVHGGERRDLSSVLAPVRGDGGRHYRFLVPVSSQADHVVAVTAAPVWDAARQKLIARSAKVVVNVAPAATGWDEPIRFPVEIDPLVRPYGLWTGNCFRGVVKQNGRPLPFAEIEVMFRGSAGDGKISRPFPPQLLIADINGVFVYAMPRAGWWGFAARIEGEMTEYEGRRVEVERVGVMWVRCIDMAWQ
ncbi:MAG: DUF4198 domain-containing protein [Thermodesulfobacteriota bacterium]